MRTKNEQGSQSIIKKLLIGWMIILFSYLAIRAVFILLGFISVSILGITLAVIPYLLVTMYFWISHSVHGIWFYLGGILLPSIIEKIALYFLGAFLYNISPIKINYVFEAIATQKPYVNLFPQPAARHIFELSFMGWEYIVGSILFSIALVLVLLLAHKKKKGALSQNNYIGDNL